MNGTTLSMLKRMTSIYCYNGAMLLPPRISLITLGVSNVAQSTSFYEKLGWKKAPQSVEGTTFIQLGAIVLGLWGYEELAKETNQIADPRNAYPGFSLSINVDSPEHVDAFLSHARSIGAKIDREPALVSWGGYTGYFSDPDGFLWEVAHNPFFPMNQNKQLVLDESTPNHF